MARLSQFIWVRLQLELRVADLKTSFDKLENKLKSHMHVLTFRGNDYGTALISRQQKGHNFRDTF